MQPEAFTFFWSGPFSQWHTSPFVVEGVSFSHAEQYMMYMKALLFDDQETARRILFSSQPREQKELGRQVRGFDEQRWRWFREGIVFTGNYAKFQQNPDLRRQLFATRGMALVEASPVDRIWGIGLAASDPRALDRAQWRGLNLLGEALTRVRETLWWEDANMRDSLVAADQQERHTFQRRNA